MTAPGASTPVADGLFEQGPDGVRLIGSHCTACDTIYFPQAISCRNPDCREKTIVRRLLGPRGRLLSYTVQRYQPPPLFRIDDWAPYAIGLVDLGGGLEVMGRMTGVALDAITIGMRVRLAAATLYVDAERGPVSTYAFAPDEEGNAA